MKSVLVLVYMMWALVTPELLAQVKDTAPPERIAAADPAPVPARPARARLVAPSTAALNSYVILDFRGTISDKEPDLDVVSAPDGSNSTITRLYDSDKNLIYGMIIPDRPGNYRIAVIADVAAFQPERSYAFADITVPDPGPNPLPPPNPEPNPPGPQPLPPPPSPPTPAPVDVYGLYAFCRELLAKMPASDPWPSYVPLIASSFDKMAANKANYTDATKFVQDTAADYKKQLGDNYKYWAYYFFDPFKTQMIKLNQTGTLPSTVDAHAEVWREVSQALKEVKTPSSRGGGR